MATPDASDSDRLDPEAINHPDVVAELTAVYHRYEQALVNNDVETMTELFWESDHVVRFGVSENLYGSSQIRAFRNSRSPAHLERSILKCQVVTFGFDTGSVTVEFERKLDGIPRQGRQSQFWRRLPQGWRVVSAHVSWLT